MSGAVVAFGCVFFAAVLTALGYVIKILLQVSVDVAVLKDGIKPLDTLEIRVTHLERDVAVLQSNSS